MKMFSSWFDHTNQGYLVAGIWQVQEYDDARNACFFLWAQTN